MYRYYTLHENYIKKVLKYTFDQISIILTSRLKIFVAQLIIISDFISDNGWLSSTVKYLYK